MIIKESINRLVVLSFILSVGTVLGGCDSQSDNRENSDARHLYRELRETIRLYTDSMKQLHDSVSTDELSERYEKRIADISFKYPAGTDNLLTEGENNELYRLMKGYIKARDKGYRPLSSSDTIPSDSIARQIPSEKPNQVPTEKPNQISE
ncbi:MAG: hypothetical protein HDS94_04655 [Bacteroidales bacterium]|nr:hypothetical protein [Bacteroidales bacterium]